MKIEASGLGFGGDFIFKKSDGVGLNLRRND
jgi:hypothetical protein